MPRNELFIKQKQLLSFAQSMDTPFYLYDEARIQKHAEALTSAFSFTPFRSYFPVRVNPNPTLLSILREKGFGVWCENEHELQICKQIGFHGDFVQYAPYIPMPKAEALAEHLYATFVITAPHCLPQKPVSRVMLSYRTRGRLFANSTFYSGLARAKQGFYEDELLSCAEHCRRFGAKSFGILLRSTPTERKSGYASSIARELFSLAVRLYEKSGITVSEIQLGDFLSAACDAQTEIAPIGALQQQLLSDARFENVLLESAVGRWLLRDAGIFVTRIAAIFAAPERPLLITEAAGAQIPDFHKLGTPHEIRVLQSKAQGGFLYYDVCGSQFHHKGNFQDHVLLPTCSAGDYLVIYDTAASCRVRSQPLGGYAPCPEFLLTSDGKIEAI